MPSIALPRSSQPDAGVSEGHASGVRIRVYMSGLSIVNASINGVYAAYLTGRLGQGLVMLVFRNGQITGADVSGVKYDGSYVESTEGFSVKLNIAIPPNTYLVQGVRAGPEGDKSELAFPLPADFLTQPFIRVNAKHVPVNVKFIKLRDFNDR